MILALCRYCLTILIYYCLLMGWIDYTLIFHMVFNSDFRPIDYTPPPLMYTWVTSIRGIVCISGMVHTQCICCIVLY